MLLGPCTALALALSLGPAPATDASAPTLAPSAAPTPTEEGTGTDAPGEAPSDTASASDPAAKSVVPEATPPPGAASDPSALVPEPSPDAPAAVENPPEPGPDSGPGPLPNDDPFAGMLDGGPDSEVPHAKAPRQREVSPEQQGIDRAEAMRRYYKALYRPASNPARPYFGVIGSIGLLGGDKTPISGRFGALDLEAGASWNRFSFAVGGGIWGGGIALDSRTENSAPFGVTAQANLGLGRMAYLGRGVLDARLGYRATYMPTRTREGATNPISESYFLPHGPEFRLDFGFMVSRVREPRFFHRLGFSVAVQVLVGGGPIELPAVAAPRIGVGYAFG